MRKSITEYIAYYLSILAKAFKDTMSFFGWKKRNLVWPLSVVAGFLVYWKSQGFDKVTEEFRVFISFILVPAGAIAILLFLINAIKAPFLKAKADRGEYNVKISNLEAELNSTKERLQLLEEERIPKIVSKPIAGKRADYEVNPYTSWATLSVKNISSTPLENVKVKIAEMSMVLEKQDEQGEGIGLYFLHEPYPQWFPANVYWFDMPSKPEQFATTISPNDTQYALIAFHTPQGTGLVIPNTDTRRPMMESKMTIEVSSPNMITWSGEYYIEYYQGRDKYEFIEWESWKKTHKFIEQLVLDKGDFQI